MFKLARLKLTLWYLLIAAIISFSFSFAIFQATSTELDRFAQSQRLRFERHFASELVPSPPRIDLDLIAETKKRFTLILISINGAILLFTGGLGYFLAGRTLKPISQMVDQQNRFVSDSSHELRTPLTSLKSAFEVNLRNPKLTLSQAKKVIEESVTEVDKLQTLSDHLLQLAQFQKSEPLKFELTSILNIVNLSIKNVSPLATKKEISLVSRVTDCQISAHPQSLVNLLVILLDNAIKYSSPKQTIIISTKIVRNSLQLSVKDHGIGIAKDDLPHIFDRFYRADQARSKTDISGYGLGLSIAREIVGQHHGSISVHSLPSRGSTFTVQLPFSSKT